MAAAGVKCGDHIACFMEFQPEFAVLLFAAEKIGAALVCRMGTKEELNIAIKDAKGPIAFVHDFIDKDLEESFYESSSELKHLITINPYTLAQKDKMLYIANDIYESYIAAI